MTARRLNLGELAERQLLELEVRSGTASARHRDVVQRNVNNYLIDLSAKEDIVVVVRLADDALTALLNALITAISDKFLKILKYFILIMHKLVNFSRSSAESLVKFQALLIKFGGY